MHIAQIGTGRVGRPTAYTLMCSNIADELTVCDVKPGLAAAFAEELKHVTASIGLDVKIESCVRSEDVIDADIILISAGQPRIPIVKMTRRDLAIQNGKIVKEISEKTVAHNSSAKYIVITNPVDSMAMLCKKYTKADFVIGTGTNLESLRFRSKLAETLGVPVSQVSGWVGGEHGDAAIPLWSTVKICDLPLEKYVLTKNQAFSKEEVLSYVKAVSKMIVDNIGGTEYGPAASFRDIVRAIANDTKEILSISIPITFVKSSEPIFVGVPVRLGKEMGSSLLDSLTEDEKRGIIGAAEAIDQTFKIALENRT
jgi:malate dehydrogenase